MVTRASSLMLIGTPVIWLMLLLGIVGAVVAPRDWPTRIMLAGVVLGGSLVMVFAHPPTMAPGPAPGYWGNIFMPAAFACVPLAFARVPRWVGMQAPVGAKLGDGRSR